MNDPYEFLLNEQRSQVDSAVLLVAGMGALAALLFLASPPAWGTPPQAQSKPKGSRLLSIAITPPILKEGADFWQVYEEALDLAIETGMDISW